MVGTARSIGSAIMAAQVQSTDVCLCFQRLRVSCILGQGSGGSPLFMINHRSS